MICDKTQILKQVDHKPVDITQTTVFLSIVKQVVASRTAHAKDGKVTGKAQNHVAAYSRAKQVLFV